MSIISLAAEMYVLRRVTEETGGTYAVALDARHLADLLMAQVAPPPTTVATVRRRFVWCRSGGLDWGWGGRGGAVGLDATLYNVSTANKQTKPKHRVRCTWTWC